MKDIANLGKKAAILMTELNPVFAAAMKCSKSRNSVSNIVPAAYGVSYQTLLNYVEDPSNYRLSTLEKRLIPKINGQKILRKRSKRKLIELSLEDFTDTTSVEFGARFGMTAEEVHKAIATWFNGYPKEGSGYFNSLKDANRLMAMYGGEYALYIPICTDTSKLRYACCSLRVRFCYKPARLTNEAFLVSAILSFPSLTGETPDLQYIGNLTGKNNVRSSIDQAKCYWHFEPINAGGSDNADDFIHMNTTAQDEKHCTLNGIWMSVNQDTVGLGYACAVYVERQLKTAVEPNDNGGADKVIEGVSPVTLVEPVTYDSLDDLARKNPAAADYFSQRKELFIIE